MINENMKTAKTVDRVVVRAAPSPTSPNGLHVGNLRTILFNYLFAKQHNGTFYLRIEDTDRERFCPGAEDLIRKSLEWMGMLPDFAPWTEYQPCGAMRQSERDYSNHIKTLIDNGSAYYAFDTAEEMDVVRASSAAAGNHNFAYNAISRVNLRNSLTLSENETKALLDSGSPYVIRFKVTPDVIITFTDIIRGEVSFNTNQMDDKVLVKSNGIPTYHMANVCDDHDMGTTHVIRGEEWLSSVPLHIMLYEAFGWDVPFFAHLPLVLNPTPLKGKLSKRNAINLGIPIFPFAGNATDDKGNSIELKGFVDEGYTPDALINFLLLLGWTPHDMQEGNEILSLLDGISKFDLHAVHKSGARYDISKLNFFNGWYLQNKVNSHDLLKCVDFANSNFSYDAKIAIIDMAKKRSHFEKELQHVVDIFVKPVILTDKQKEGITDLHKETFLEFVNIINSNDSWNIDSIKQYVYDATEKTGIKMNKFMPVVRVVLAAGVTGPDMITFMSILPKSEITNRISVILDSDSLYKDGKYEEYRKNTQYFS